MCCYSFWEKDIAIVALCDSDFSTSQLFFESNGSRIQIHFSSLKTRCFNCLQFFRVNCFISCVGPAVFRFSCCSAPFASVIPFCQVPVPFLAAFRAALRSVQAADLSACSNHCRRSDWGISLSADRNTHKSRHRQGKWR